MKDLVISTLATAIFLVLFLNGLRVMLQKKVNWAIQKIHALSIPKFQLTLPSKSDIGAYVKGLVDTAISRPLVTLVLLVLSSMPLMTRYIGQLPRRFRLVYVVAVGLAYACFIMAHINRGMASRDSSTVVMYAFWAYLIFILVGLGAMQSIADAAAKGTPSLVLCAVLFGWAPLCLVYLTKRLLDRCKGFMPRVGVVVACVLMLEMFDRLWLASYLEGIGVVPPDVFDGTPIDMLVRLLEIGGDPPLQHANHHSRLIYDIVRRIQFAVVTILLSLPGNQQNRNDE